MDCFTLCLASAQHPSLHRRGLAQSGLEAVWLQDGLVMQSRKGRQPSAMNRHPRKHHQRRCSVAVPDTRASPGVAPPRVQPGRPGHWLANVRHLSPVVLSMTGSFLVPHASLVACMHLRGPLGLTCGCQLTAWRGAADRANRPAPELEALIGYFINPVALRTQLHGGLSFRQVVSCVRDTVVGAQGNAEVQPLPGLACLGA